MMVAGRFWEAARAMGQAFASLLGVCGRGGEDGRARGLTNADGKLSITMSRRVAGSPGRRVAGSPGRRVAP